MATLQMFFALQTKDKSGFLNFWFSLSISNIKTQCDFDPTNSYKVTLTQDIFIVESEPRSNVIAIQIRTKTILTH